MSEKPSTHCPETPEASQAPDVADAPHAAPPDGKDTPADVVQDEKDLAASGLGAGGCKSAALGCGIFVSMVIVILVVTGVYLVFNWRTASASFITSQLTDKLQQTPLPLDQQQQMSARIRDVGERFAAGRLTVGQVRYMGAHVFSDPMLTTGILYFAGDKLLERSGLSKDQRSADRLALQRFTHGVFTGAIPQSDVAAIAGPIRDSGDPDTLHVKKTVSDDELRRFIDAAKQAADRAGVPQRAYQIDVAARFDKIVGKALREAQAMPKSADESGRGGVRD